MLSIISKEYLFVPFVIQNVFWIFGTNNFLAVLKSPPYESGVQLVYECGTVVLVPSVKKYVYIYKDLWDWTDENSLKIYLI